MNTINNMKNMTINADSYTDLHANLLERLGDLRNIMVLDIPEYKNFFTQTGNWDKRKKFFDFTMKIYKNSKKTDNVLRDMGKILIIISEFIEDNNNDKILMEYQFDNGRYNDEFKIKIKFISYDIAAKILLSQ